MLDYSKRQPLALSLANFTDESISRAIEELPKGLPCTVVAINKPDGTHSVPIVTVKFEAPAAFNMPNVEMPVLGPEYIRLPIRIGDHGISVPVDAPIGAITGLGSVFNTITTTGNLEDLAFMPIGNTNWHAFNPSSLILYSIATGALINVDETSVTISSGGVSFALNSSGVTITGNVVINGSLTNNGHLVGSTHTHSGVQTGSGTTGGPT